MRIGVDARMYGPSVGGGGLGRYVEQLVKELQKIDQSDRCVLFLKKENFKDCKLTNDRFEKKLADIHWYGLSEQLALPKIIDQEKLDLVHFPHWNVPLKIKTPFVVTIHDLILLEEPGSAKATTRHPFIYSLKYLAYKKVLKHAIEKSKAIIAVSEYTKKSILNHFPTVDQKKIKVVYEGVTDLKKNPAPSSLSPVPCPYFLYIGNAYPHKNLLTLISAFELVRQAIPNAHLILAGRDDIFYKQLKIEIVKRQLDPFITITPSPTDNDLHSLLQGTKAYVFPSRIEGFGLPPLEAMQHNVPVASSNASCLPEILGKAALYFPPSDVKKMSEAMIEIFTNNTLRHQLTKQGGEQIKKYSWEKMANKINDLYHLCDQNN